MDGQMNEHMDEQTDGWQQHPILLFSSSLNANANIQIWSFFNIWSFPSDPSVSKPRASASGPVQCWKSAAEPVCFRLWVWPSDGRLCKADYIHTRGGSEGAGTDNPKQWIQMRNEALAANTAPQAWLTAHTKLTPDSLSIWSNILRFYLVFIGKSIILCSILKFLVTLKIKILLNVFDKGPLCFSSKHLPLHQISFLKLVSFWLLLAESRTFYGRIWLWPDWFASKQSYSFSLNTTSDFHQIFTAPGERRSVHKSERNKTFFSRGWVPEILFSLWILFCSCLFLFFWLNQRLPRCCYQLCYHFIRLPDTPVFPDSLI